MIMTTADGHELEVDQPIINAFPNRLFLPIKNMKLQEATDMLCTPASLPLKGYEDYTEAFSFCKRGKNDVMVTLRPSHE